MNEKFEELMRSERNDPVEFWKNVTSENAALLISDTQPKDWPVSTIVYEGEENNGLSRLHLATCSGHEEMVQFLLDQGADIHAA